MVLVLDKPRQVLEHIGTLGTWSNEKNLSTLALVIVIPGNGKPIPVYLMISTWKIHQFSRDFFHGQPGNGQRNQSETRNHSNQRQLILHQKEIPFFSGKLTLYGKHPVFEVRSFNMNSTYHSRYKWAIHSFCAISIAFLRRSTPPQGRSVLLNLGVPARCSELMFGFWRKFPVGKANESCCMLMVNVDVDDVAHVRTMVLVYLPTKLGVSWGKCW